MTKKTFLLGVGCQKGGTTWLHDYLKRHPACNFGFAKEYHVFDALDLQFCKYFARSKFKTLDKAIRDQTLSSSHKNLLKHIDFYRDSQNYYDYFDYLQQKNRSGVVGDITPTYGALPTARYKEIKKSFEGKGFDVKVIFLMRDPLERIWSQIRMCRKRALKRNPSHVFEHSEFEQLAMNYDEHAYEVRTRYENTINNLEAVFTPDKIYYGFYEELFTPKSIKDICKFLDITYIKPNFKKIVNASPKDKTDIPSALSNSVVQHYQSTYDFCLNKFGEKFIINIWPNSVLSK